MSTPKIINNYQDMSFPERIMLVFIFSIAFGKGNDISRFLNRTETPKCIAISDSLHDQLCIGNDILKDTLKIGL